MSFLLTSSEAAVAQRECEEALAKAQQAVGLSRLKLFHEAFPFAINFGPADGWLRLAWNPAASAISISDAEGFLTALREADLAELPELLRTEARTAGTLRFLITGKKPPRPKHHTAQSVLPKLTLADLGLNRKEPRP